MGWDKGLCRGWGRLSPAASGASSVRLPYVPAATFSFINADQALYYMANPENNRKVTLPMQLLLCLA